MRKFEDITHIIYKHVKRLQTLKDK